MLILATSLGHFATVLKMLSLQQMMN